MIFLGAFPESSNVPSQMGGLNALTHNTGLTVHEALELAFRYYYGNAEDHGITNLFDPRVKDLKLGGEAANAAEFEQTRMRELAEAQAAATRWAVSGGRGDLDSHGKVEMWLASFLKKDAYRHVRAYERNKA